MSRGAIPIQKPIQMGDQCHHSTTCLHALFMLQTSKFTPVSKFPHHQITPLSWELLFLPEQFHPSDVSMAAELCCWPENLEADRQEASLLHQSGYCPTASQTHIHNHEIHSPDSSTRRRSLLLAIMDQIKFMNYTTRYKNSIL